MNDKITPNKWIPTETISSKLYEKHVLWLTDEAYIQITRALRNDKWCLTIFKMHNDFHPTDNHNGFAQKLWSKSYFTSHKYDTDTAKRLALEIARNDVAPPYYATYNSKKFWTDLYEAVNDAHNREYEFQKLMRETPIGI